MKEDARQKFRRRNFFIKKGLQSSFVIGFSLAVLAGFFLNMLLAYLLIDRELAAGLYRSHIKIRTTADIALPILLKLSAVTIPLIIAISAVIGYYLTRRVELPLLSFRDALRRAAAGDLTARLPKDAVSGLSEVFDRTCASLERSFRSVKKSAYGLEKKVERFGSLLGREKGLQKAEMIKALQDISEESGRTLKEISRFRV